MHQRQGVHHCRCPPGARGPCRTAAADHTTAMTSKQRRDLKESLHPPQVASRTALFEFDVALGPPMAQLTACGAPEATDWRAAVDTLLFAMPDGAPILCDLRAVTRVRPAVGSELVRLVAARRVAFVTRAGVASRLARQLSSANAQHILIITDYRTALRWLLFADDTLPPRKRGR
jgi:hypothetical protein